MPTFAIGLDDGRTLHVDADDQASALTGAQQFLGQQPDGTSKRMPVFTVQTPTGHTLDIEAPDQETALKGAQWWHAQQQQSGEGPWTPYQNLPPIPDGYSLEHPDGRSPPLPQGFVPEGPWTEFQNQPAPDAPVTAGGLAKAAGAGAVSGFVGLPGDVTSLLNLARRGYGALTGNGYDPAKDDFSLGQTYAKVRAAADNIYQPQNKAEGWAKTVGEFAPALIAGPEEALGKGSLNAARVLTKRAVLQAAAPAIAAKVAGTAAQGTPLEPYAGPAAALLTGGLTVKGKAPEVSFDAAKATTDASYAAARNAGVMYDQNAIASRAAAAKADLTNRGISEQSAPSAHDTLDSFINNTAPMSLTSLEEQRQLFTKDAGKGGKEGFAANAVKGVIDDVMSDPRNAAAWSGADPATAYALLQKGRTQALATQRLRDIEDLQSKAQVNKDVNGTDLSKGLRTQFGSELKADYSTLSGDPALAAQLQNISKGSFPQGIASRLGGGDLSKWRALELAGLAFPVTMPAVVGARALGYTLSKIADARVQAKVAALKQLVATKGGVPVTQGQNPWMTRFLLGTLGANGAPTK